MSRREREEIEKQRAQAHYQKLHAEGKTEQARADLARLAIIRQQRDDAKKRREAELKGEFGKLFVILDEIAFQFSPFELIDILHKLLTIMNGKRFLYSLILDDSFILRSFC